MKYLNRNKVGMYVWNMKYLNRNKVGMYVWNMKFHLEQEQGGEVRVEHEVPCGTGTRWGCKCGT
jgi:hypothetical protein